MTEAQRVSDPAYIEGQYANAACLDAGRRLYQTFSTNKYPWQLWVFEKLRLAPDTRLLELGCGPGDLWQQNLQRLPAGLEVTVSDISQETLAQAEESLGESRSGFDFRVIDAQTIPYPDEVFDVVIANDVLHHVPDLTKALSEISRVLKATGRLYASATGPNHMKELSALLKPFDARLGASLSLPAQAFRLESGFDLLSEHFSRVALFRYADTLHVSDAGMLVEYVASMQAVMAAEPRAELAELVAQALCERGGQLRIVVDAGLFEASGKLAE